MAASVYECMFLLDTSKVAGDVPGAAKQLQTVLERHHAEILASRPWDERRLAYSIKKNKKGLYYLTYFRTEGRNITAIEHDFSLNEMVLRMMVLKIDPKLVDTMLALAREEHAVALHNIQQEPAENGAVGGGEAPAPRKPRRDEKD